jgi:hypothetical protein
MTNEFQSLTDDMVLHLWEKAILAYKHSPRIMPYNDRNYLLQRKVKLKAECLRRGLISSYPL